MKKGFTLVELAISIVIIGLVVTGVLAGKELIHQAGMTSLITQMREYNNAVSTFRVKYGSLPGDTSKATMFGIDRDTSGTQNTSKIFLGTTNDGDGDGFLESSTNVINSAVGSEGSVFDGEVANFWVHLSNAGLIKETITQTLDCSSSIVGSTPCNGLAGQGFPSARVGVGILVSAANEMNGTKRVMKETYFQLGVGSGNIVNSGSGGTQVSGGGLNLLTEDAAAIDLKLDDGKPATGSALSILALNCSSCTPKGIALAYNYLPSQPCSTSTAYNLSTTTNACTLAVRTGF